MIKKILQLAKQHKIVAGIIILIIMAGGYFLLKGKSVAPTSYVFAKAERGNIIAAISGTGQVSVSNQVDVKAKTSGDVTAVNVKVGQVVKSGALLAQINASDALRAVRDAQTSLETAKLDLEQTLAPVKELTLLQSEDSLIQAEQSKQDAIDNLAKSYDDGFNTVSNAFLDLPSVMTGLNSTLFSYSFNSTQNNIDYYAGAIKTYGDDNGTTYRDDAYNKYQSARTAYDQNFLDYKNTNRSSDKTAIENLISETYETVKSIAEAVKSANNLIQLYQDKLTTRNLTPQTLSTTALTNLSSYTSKTNSYLTSLLSAKSSIQSYKDAIISAERAIKQKELSLADTKAGADELTIRAKRIAVQQKQDALTTANQALYDCSARAPFDGIVAKVSVKKGDTISSGTAVATIITKQQLAEISLNEVDVARVKTGQKVTASFDAVDGLNITGVVAEVDTLGTVSQGVVTYNVQIVFDTQDDRVKPGMSVSVAIITDMKQNVLIVPSSALKSSVNGSYVEMPNETVTAGSTGASSAGVVLNNSPKQQSVVAGISDDTSTEIISGLNEGDVIIVRTVSGSITTANGSTGGNALGGSGIRIPGAGGFGR
jgi:HlyD family secretion protein